MPVSGSTSTSTTWSANALPTPPGLTVARPTMGPPVPFNRRAKALNVSDARIRGHEIRTGFSLDGGLSTDQKTLRRQEVPAGTDAEGNIAFAAQGFYLSRENSGIIVVV